MSVLSALLGAFGRVAEATGLKQTQWPRPTDDHSGESMPEDALRFIYDHHQCPYCHGELYGGPRGGASLNMFCGGTCHARFNVVDPDFGFVPMGQFMGTVPQDFLDWLDEQDLEKIQ